MDPFRLLEAGMIFVIGGVLGATFFNSRKTIWERLPNALILLAIAVNLTLDLAGASSVLRLGLAVILMAASLLVPLAILAKRKRAVTNRPT